MIDVTECIVNTPQNNYWIWMLTFDLRSLIQAYEAKTGLRISYQELSEMCGISVDTLKSLAARPTYNATLGVITSISLALGVSPLKYFGWNTDELGDERE